MKPRVSIVMPVHNAALYVAEALRSASGQSVRDIEIIAVDDGSTDGSGAILSDHAREDDRLRVFHQVNGGTASARNAGIAEARADLIAFLDADDRLARPWLERMLDAVSSAPDLDIVFPRHRHVDALGRPLGPVSAPRRRRYGAHDLMIDNPIHATTGCVMRRAACARAGDYDTRMPACIDIDYFVRAVAGRGRVIGAVDEVLADWRQHAGQITGDWRRLRAGWRRMVAKADDAGHGLSQRDLRRARGRTGVFWATIAYNGGDYRAARRLMAECLSHEPGMLLHDAHARIRAAAVLASFGPPPLHRGLRRVMTARAIDPTECD